MRLQLGNTLAGVLLAVGCGVGERDDEDVSERNGFTITSNWGCRTCDYRNSPTAGLDPIGSFVVGEADHVPALRSIRLWNGLELEPDVSGGKLAGHRGGTTYEGGDLVGAELVFTNAAGFDFTVDIYSFATHGDWVTGTDVATYGLSHADNGEDTNVCPGFDLDETSVVVLPGETYDDGSKTVVDAPGWASLACRGHAIAKMKMMGHAPEDGYGSNPKQRQATYKMLTADYCGNGVSYTQLGQPLGWGDELGNFPLPVPGVSVEAKWTHQGAACLDTPRLVARTKVACKPAQCGGGVDLDGAHWISWRP